jgi:YHS domain-containing protein
MTKDPVCGMEVDTLSAEYSAQYKGTDYYFCSESCKKQFTANPEKFVKSAKSSPPK